MLSVLLLFGSMLTACDRLDDGDDGVAGDILPGTWAFSYELYSTGDVTFAINYEQVIFRADGTVSIVYPGGSLKGTYQAGSTAIRIEGTVSGSEQRDMLWRIVTISSRQITAEYKFTLDGQDVTALVTLDKSGN